MSDLTTPQSTEYVKSNRGNNPLVGCLSYAGDWERRLSDPEDTSTNGRSHRRVSTDGQSQAAPSR
jgi:hypothetical protein